MIDALRTRRSQDPGDALDTLIAGLVAMAPPRPAETPGHQGFAVPLQLATDDGELRLLTTLTHFGTAVDVTVSELRIEAFLPADAVTAETLRRADTRA